MGCCFLWMMIFDLFISIVFIFTVLLMSSPCCVILDWVRSVGICVCACFIFTSHVTWLWTFVILLCVSFWCFPIDSEVPISPMKVPTLIPLHLLLRHLGTSLLDKCHVHVKYLYLDGFWVLCPDSFPVPSSIYLLLFPSQISNILPISEFPFGFLVFSS